MNIRLSGRIPTQTWLRLKHSQLPVVMSDTAVKVPDPFRPLRPFSSTAENDRMSSQRPGQNGDLADETSYVLTLLTDSAHQRCMNSLRSTYFPARINKIPAHITLFHALPASKLDSEIIPAIKDIAARTSSYRIQATGPSRMRHGIMVNVADDIDHANHNKHGRNMTRIIHAELRKKWGEWLSEQDSTPVKIHYTVMNKVNDDKSVDSALKELKESFQKGEDLSHGHFQLGNGNHEKQGTGKTESGRVDDCGTPRRRSS